MPEGVTIATLIAQLRLDLSGFEESARKLAASLKTVEDGFAAVSRPSDSLNAQLADMSSVLGSLGLNTGTLGRAMTLLMHPLTMIGAGLLGVEEAARRSLRAIMDNSREVGRLMAVSGLGAEAADNLGDTFKILGLGTDAVTVAMFRMANELETGAVGLTRLGISITDSAGQMKAEGELFLEVRDRIASLGSAAERSAALYDIFGRSGRALTPIFSLNREEFIKWMERAERVSPWAEEAQQKATELTRAVSEMSVAWEGLREPLGLALASYATMAANSITNLIVKVNDLVHALSTLPGVSVPKWPALPDIEVPPQLKEVMGFLLGKIKATQDISVPDVQIPPNLQRIMDFFIPRRFEGNLESLNLGGKPPSTMQAEGPTGLLPEAGRGREGGGLVTEPPGAATRTSALQMQADVQKVMQDLAAAQAKAAQQAGEREIAVRREQMAEVEALQARLRDIDTLTAKTREAYDTRLEIARRAADVEGVSVRAVEMERQERLDALAQQRLQVQGQIAGANTKLDQALAEQALAYIQLNPNISEADKRTIALNAQFEKLARQSTPEVAEQIRAMGARIIDLTTGLGSLEASTKAAGALSLRIDTTRLKDAEDKVAAFTTRYNKLVQDLGPENALTIRAKTELDAAITALNDIAWKEKAVVTQTELMAAAFTDEMKLMGTLTAQWEAFAEAMAAASREAIIAREAITTRAAALQGAGMQGVRPAREEEAAIQAQIGAVSRQRAVAAEELYGRLNQGTLEESSEYARKLREAVTDADLALIKLTSDLRDVSARVPTEGLAEGLARVRYEAELVGTTFDTTGAEIHLYTQALMEAQARGDTTSETVQRLRERLEELKGLREVKGMVSDIFGALNRAMSTAITGIIQGTTTAKEAWHNLGQSMILAVNEMIVKRAFKALEAGFDAMLDAMDARAMVSIALQMILQAFGGGSGGSLTQLAGPGSTGTANANIQAGGGAEWGYMQRGGVVTRPTRAIVGEAGPEAIIPLKTAEREGLLDGLWGEQQAPVDAAWERIARAFEAVAASTQGAGGGVDITIVDQRKSGELEQKETTAEDGRRKLEIFVKDAVKGGIGTGEFDRLLGGLYGLTRVGTPR